MKKWSNPPFWIDYGYTSLPKRTTYAYKIDKKNKKVYRFLTKVPQILKIDPRGHFTFIRCCSIIVFDRIMSKFGFTQARLANLCELLANYPNF